MQFAWQPNSRRHALITSDGLLGYGELGNTHVTEEQATSLAWSPDGQHMACGVDQTLKVLSVQAGEEPQLLWQMQVQHEVC